MRTNILLRGINTCLPNAPVSATAGATGAPRPQQGAKSSATLSRLMSPECNTRGLRQIEINALLVHYHNNGQKSCYSEFCTTLKLKDISLVTILMSCSFMTYVY